MAIHAKTTDNGVAAPDKTRYLHRDALGSIDTITDGQGNIVERMSYEPFGARRGGDWRVGTGLPTIPALTNRGFTGHEHVDEMDLIHMNGRVYDPTLGRFLSADPTMQFPYSSQGFNRYSYVQNNPLKYVDPSGFGLFSFIKRLVSGVKHFVKEVARTVKKYKRVIIAVVVTVLTYGAAAAWLGSMTIAGTCGVPLFTAAQVGMMAGAASGFVAGAITTGEF